MLADHTGCFGGSSDFGFDCYLHGCSHYHLNHPYRVASSDYLNNYSNFDYYHSGIGCSVSVHSPHHIRWVFVCCLHTCYNRFSHSDSSSFIVSHSLFGHLSCYSGICCYSTAIGHCNMAFVGIS